MWYLNSNQVKVVSEGGGEKVVLGDITLKEGKGAR